MGNVCSSGQKKNDADNTSEKSEESPSYHVTQKKEIKTSKSDSKEAPLADPEPISDLSTGHNASLIASSPTNGNICKETVISGQSKLQKTLSESVSSTPQTTIPPCEISLPAFSADLPSNLLPLQGKPILSRRTESDKKIILYVLSADDNNHKTEKSVLHSVFQNLKDRCACRGFEILISDTHNSAVDSIENNASVKTLDVKKWVDNPLEAQGGHEGAANSLAEISRHSNFSYIIPVLFLGTSLGTPLLPLTIESQDFTTALKSAENTKKALLEKWYLEDNSAQPSCYRLNTKSVTKDSDQANLELNQVLTILIEIFSKELCDSYLTTVVEQEINNTVLMSQELSKRCIWILTGCLPPKISENPSPLEIEMNRRLTSIHNDLKNHLSEKNLIRIPPSIQVQEDQLAAIIENLLNVTIDGIIEEHINKFYLPNCTFGVDKRLLSELEFISQYSKILGQNCAHFGTIEKIKSYVTGISTSPLIIHGNSGSGKSVITAKILQNMHTWVPDCYLILRYTNLTEISSDLTTMLWSIAEQLSVLISNKPCRIEHTLESYDGFIKTSIESTKLSIVIVIDLLDDIHGLDSINWLPTKFSTNIKIILTVSNDKMNGNRGNWLINELKKHDIPAENFIHLTKFTEEQWNDIVSFGGGGFYAANGALQLPENLRNADEKSPLQAKILWWLTWLGVTDLEDTQLPTIIDKVFDTIEKNFNPDVVGFILSILVAAKNGILETDLITLLQESNVCKGVLASRLWFKFCWIMGSMLLHNNKICIMDKKIKLSASQRYSDQTKQAHRILYEHYKNQNIIFEDKKGKYKSYNIQKLIQLPYHAFMIESQKQQQQQQGGDQQKSLVYSQYLTDLQWICEKFVATGCVHILSDIHFVESQLTLDEQHQLSSIAKAPKNHNSFHLCLLRNFIDEYFRELNYDGKQFFSLFSTFVRNKIQEQPNIGSNQVIQKWNEFLLSVKTTYLERLSEFQVENLDEHDEQQQSIQSKGFDMVTNLNDTGYFVASINTGREEICVWDVSKSKRVRKLIGIPQPTALCPIGDYSAAVLCRREIKVIDLDNGKFKVTLKGVMNQKMPYFGLHDSKHVVCLSRNRMYVNLMNLESGDCVTTFKAGEDRFLNSLLVSGDGRILVCGDETQKPFPLLVWHLSQRKLLYDLRIPHHDFITSLSAITHEGSYVCVVAKELNEPTPNFIVVYDLQSGTLFKKWKPSCNTASLAISQTNACVVAGLEDARILVWDLVTGNCRCTLSGHNAPVTLLKLDPTGKVLLSGDKNGRDTSIRLWELDSGKALAVYTPPAKISACEILSNGKYVVLALENHPNLITLILRNYTEDGIDNSDDAVIDNFIYGNPENDGKTFDLK